MRSSVVVALLLLLGCVIASPALPPHPAPTPESSPSTTDTPFSISEYEVDRDGLWTDHEIPLSDASLAAIRQATPATPDDIAAWNAEAEPGMQVQAVMDEEMDAEAGPEAEPESAAEPAAEPDAETNDETETEAEAEPEQDTNMEPDADAEADAEAEPEAESEAEADAGADTEQDTEAKDDLEIAHGRHGRMLLIPHSRHLMMRRIILMLKHLIDKLKARTPLARVSLRLNIEPITTPTPTPTPTPTRSRRPPPSLGIIHRPRPVAIRLVPSRADLQTRRMLARCSMLLRLALQRMHKMRQMLIKERMKTRRSRIRGLRFPGRGVILFRSNNITATAPQLSFTRLTRFEIEGEKNGTVTIIAPRVNATLSHSIIVINRGTIVLLNRSRNNTLSATLPTRPTGYRRRFPHFPARSKHIMTAVADAPLIEAPEQPVA